MKNKIFMAVFIVAIIPSILFSAANEQGFVMWHDFESANYWSTDDWGDNCLSEPKITSDYAASGKKSLQLTLNAAKKGQTGMVQLLDIGDMSGVENFSFDIYNSSMTNMKACLMLKTGNNWVYHESKTREIKPGWNKGIVFDLKAPEYGSDGKYDKNIKEINFTRRFGIKLEPSANAVGYIFLDNVRFSGTGLEKLLPVEQPQGSSPGEEVLIDSFETGRLRWSAAGTWSCATNVEPTTETVSAGKTAMKASYDMKSPGQNAVFMIEDSLDLSEAYELKVDVYYPDEFPSSISLSMGTGDKWVWQEYVNTKLKKGWNRDVTFYFKDKRWKNERSKWANNVNPDDIKNVKRLSLLMLPSNIGQGYVIFDNVRIVTTDRSKLAGIMPANTGALAFYSWNSFEKGVNWNAQTDTTGALAVNPAFEFGNQAKKGMECVFSTQTNVDKAGYNFKGNLDFSDAAGIKFDVYNPNTYSVKITLAFQTGQQETWVESKQVGIGPGWNKDVFFDFLSTGFKSAKSNWNFTDYFDSRNDIRNMILSVFPDQKVKGSLYFTDFKLARRNFFGDIGSIAGISFANKSKVTFEPVKYTAWDSGAGEGTFESPASMAVWAPHKEGTWGVCEISQSDMYASYGKNSMRIDYKDTNVKFGVEYSAPSTVPISDKTAMTMDIYNPGRPLKFSVAFTSDTGTGDSWNEMNDQVTINPGWNKNIAIFFDRPKWKKISGGVTDSPMPLSLKSNMVKMALIFTGGYEGAVYVDNIRWGTKDGVRITDGAVEQDVSVLVTPMDEIEAKVTFRGSYFHGQNTGLSVLSGHLILRGFGNELTLFSGEPVSVMDDVFGLVNSAAIGQNIMGLTVAGTFYPLNTSYVFSGLSLNSLEPWYLGTSFLATARLKTYFLDKNYVGAVYMHSRRGYDEDTGLPDIFSADIEQSAHVLGIDAAGSVPVPGLDDVNISLKGEVLASVYGTLSPVFMLDGPPMQYAPQVINESDGKNFYYIESSLHWQDLKISGLYRQIDPAFAGYYISADQKIGLSYGIVKATYIVDNLMPFSIMRSWSPEWAAFVRMTQLMVEYDMNYSTVDAYGRKTYTIDLKNDESLALYNYHVWFKYSYEGNESKIPSLSVSGFTKILAADMITLKLLGRWIKTRGTVLDGSVYATRDYDRTTLFVEASLKPYKDLTLTGSYKWLSSKYSNNGNWYARCDLSLWGSAFVSASYGEEPLSGYWSDEASNDTVNKYMISFTGRF